ncbi:hypothetical protein BBJ28_00026927 [Nothophytophthora sp. Chile5]|nr:hypothetical protein BBJ28_00026927 [Nothophytophthora sp. Chile5]
MVIQGLIFLIGSFDLFKRSTLVGTRTGSTTTHRDDGGDGDDDGNETEDDGDDGAGRGASEAGGGQSRGDGGADGGQPPCGDRVGRSLTQPATARQPPSHHSGDGVAPPSPQYQQPQVQDVLAPAPPALDSRVLGLKKQGLPDPPEFKGMDGTMMLSTWLNKSSLANRRRENTFSCAWTTKDLYLVVSAKMQGDTTAWFLHWSSSAHPHDKTRKSLTVSLQTKYDSHLDENEVMARIYERKQLTGERLSDFAGAFMELRSGKYIRESWYVNSFINSMDNQTLAPFVKAWTQTT